MSLLLGAQRVLVLLLLRGHNLPGKRRRRRRRRRREGGGVDSIPVSQRKAKWRVGFSVHRVYPRKAQ